MFFRRIDDRTRLCLSVPQYADELYALTDRNRAMLRQWLPWVDGATAPQKTRDFVTSQLALFAESKGLHTTIFHDGAIAGVLAFNAIDSLNQTGHIGYWLGADFQGKGIMTACVRELMRVGEEFYSLGRFEIRCAVGNAKSRAIPERLGFTNEGTLRRAERVNENWYDVVVYGKVTVLGDAGPATYSW